MRPLNNRDRSELYMCMGENYKPNIPQGNCGDIKTLMDWLKYLTKEDAEYVNRLFDSTYSNRDLVEYIFINYGKRLKAL